MFGLSLRRPAGYRHQRLRLLGHRHGRHGDPAATEAGLKKFEAVHEALIADLFAQPQAGAVLEFAHKVFAQLRNSCHALLALRSDVSPQTQDLLAALGERISAWVLAN